MSRRRHRRGSEDTNISFLDIICCGFGAIVLLLVIVKPTEPIVLEESPIQQKGQVRVLQERLFEIRGQVKYLETELNAKHEQLGIDQRRVAILRGEFEALNSRVASIDEGGADDAEEALDLQIALQSLTREMKRLIRNRQPKNDYIAGVPVDSEYIIFVIDTSGSMTDQGFWGSVLRQVDSVLRIYPKVKGIQVMNNLGAYMFGNSRGEWMTDTPARRRAILQKLAIWRAGSASNPVPGITQAITRFYDKNKKISIYVFGDDYPGRSIQRVVRHVEELNKKNSRGETMVRIHTVGFPVQLRPRPGMSSAAMRYASLMRELAERNNGVFVGTSHVN
ncbi:MAG: VWA domain-containing protein [Gammaproteobacteria bacterium]|nr:VWA domain-containing protein [Gammaproteobacteria bacterium]